MPDYITLPIESDPDILLAGAYDFIQARWPNWEPNDANLDVAILGATAQIASEVRDLSRDVPLAIFKFYGDSIIGLPPVIATPATATTTWTMVDVAGYTIPEGTLVGVPAAGDDLVVFRVTEEVVVPPGSAATGAGGVPIEAIEPGEQASGLGVAGTDLELLDALAYVTNVELAEPTTGGTDEESDELYVNRLSARLQLMAPRPILARDFALLARDVPGVWRATAIDNFIPPDTDDAERAVFVVALDKEGTAVSAPVKAAVDAYLQEQRELNFIVNVGDPSSVSLDVTFTVRCLPGFDAAEVEERAVAAIETYLSPASWGTDPTVAVEGDRQWRNVTTVRYLELAEVLNRVFGVDYVEALTFAETGDALSTADVVMTGVAPLPSPGTINGTANAA